MSYQWYYSKDALLKGKREEEGWMPFCKHDNEALEAAHRRASGSSGEDGKGENDSAVVPVLGASYDANVLGKIGKPVYFESAGFVMDRTNWFVKDGKGVVSPIFGGEALQLDKANELAQRSIQQAFESGAAQKSMADSSSNQCAHTFSTQTYTYTWKYDGSIERRLAAGLFSITSSSQMVFRGRNEHLRGVELGVDDVPVTENCYCAEVSHVVFVIHGIGQKFAQTIEKDVFTMTQQFQHLAQKGLFGEKYKKGSKRIEFVPVQWRAHLDLNDDTLANIQTKGANTVNFVQTVVMDVLYFMSPKYSQQLVDTVCASVNRSYQLFMERHPRFHDRGGMISLFAHSLGSVIAYELIMGQDLHRDNSADAEEESINRFSSALETQFSDQRRIFKQACRLQGDNGSAEGSCEDMEVPPTPTISGATPFPSFLTFPKLDFHVTNLILLGSPLATFLSLRGVQIGRGNKHALLPPPTTRLFNIFHDQDPIASRLEPLFLPDALPAFSIPVWSTTSLAKMTAAYWSSFKKSAPKAPALVRRVTSRKKKAKLAQQSNPAASTQNPLFSAGNGSDDVVLVEDGEEEEGEDAQGVEVADSTFSLFTLPQPPSFDFFPTSSSSSAAEEEADAKDTVLGTADKSKEAAEVSRNDGTQESASVDCSNKKKTAPPRPPPPQRQAQVAPETPPTGPPDATPAAPVSNQSGSSFEEHVANASAKLSSMWSAMKTSINNSRASHSAQKATASAKADPKSTERQVGSSGATSLKKEERSSSSTTVAPVPSTVGDGDSTEDEGGLGMSLSDDDDDEVDDALGEVLQMSAENPEGGAHLFMKFNIDFSRIDFVMDTASSFSISKLANLVTSHTNYYENKTILRFVFGILTVPDQALLFPGESEDTGGPLEETRNAAVSKL